MDRESYRGLHKSAVSDPIQERRDERKKAESDPERERPLEG